MKKGLLILLLLLSTGCFAKEKVEEKKESKVEIGLYETIRVDVNLLNEQTDEYYLFLVKPGTIGQDGAATSIYDFVGPFEIEDFKVELELSKSNIRKLLDGADELKLQLVITTREDHLIRNPLNEEMFISFELDEYMLNYLATKQNFKIEIVDKYPDGILSLPFQDADFVVKLKFKEGITPRHSYNVGIREVMASSSTGLGLIRIGAPLSNKGNYYNAVFYSQNMKNYVGVLEIEGEVLQNVSYEGGPLRIEFDENGKPKGDAVIEVIITEGI